MVSNIENHGKWGLHTGGPVICEKTERHGKWERHIVGPEKWSKKKKPTVKRRKWECTL